MRANWRKLGYWTLVLALCVVGGASEPWWVPVVVGVAGALLSSWRPLRHWLDAGALAS